MKRQRARRPSSRTLFALSVLLLCWSTTGRATALEPAAVIDITADEVFSSAMGMTIRSYYGPLISPNGKFLASGLFSGQNSSIRVRDALTGKERAVMKSAAGSGPLRILAFTPDSKKLLTATLMGNVSLWNLETEKLEKDIQLPAVVNMALPQLPAQLQQQLPPGAAQSMAGALGGGAMLGDAAFSYDGSRFALERSFDLLVRNEARDKTAKLRSLGKGNLQQQMARFQTQDLVGRLAFSADSKSLITVQLSGEIRRWNLANGKWKTTVKAGKYPFTHQVHLSVDGRRAAMRTKRGLFVIDAARGKVIRKVKAKQDDEFSVAMSADGRRLATRRGDRDIQIIDIDSGDLLLEIKPREKELTGMKLSADGGVLVTSHLQGTGGGAGQGGFGPGAAGQNQQPVPAGKIYVWNLAAQLDDGDEEVEEKEEAEEEKAAASSAAKE